jgi:hypothetical protein
MTTPAATFDQPDPQCHLESARRGIEEDVSRQRHRLSDGWGSRSTHLRPLGSLMQEVARSVVESGLEIHDCSARARCGGVCLTPSSTELGVIVTWTTHDVLALDAGRYVVNRDVHDLMNFVLGDVLSTLGWDVRDFGRAGATIVVGRRSQDVDGGEDQ